MEKSIFDFKAFVPHSLVEEANSENEQDDEYFTLKNYPLETITYLESPNKQDPSHLSNANNLSNLREN